MIESIAELAEKYPFVTCFDIGKSVMGRPIPCLRIGEGGRRVLLAGAFHGLEYLTAALLVRFAEDYAAHIAAKSDFFGCNAAALHNELYIIPMVNPDGTDIARNGIDIKNKAHRELIERVGICDFGSVWQANARGVDLNHNYDAEWSSVKDGCAPSKYGGEYPESEPETQAVAALVRSVGFDVLIAFHSQGREIYCDFSGYEPPGALRMAQQMARESGYKVCRPTGTAAFGGCKDWFIKEFDKCGFTVEIGKGKNPLPMSMLDDVYEENARLILCALRS